MSTGPTTPQQDQGTDVEATGAAVREPVRFPRLELPAVPVFSRPLTPADELPVQRPLVDEPAGAWQSPFPAPDPTNTYTFQVVPPPPPAQHAPPLDPPQPHAIPRSVHATYCAMPSATPTMPAPASTTSPMPVLAQAPELTQGVDDRAADAPWDVSPIALGILLVAAALLVWASRMAFSPALLAMAALMLAEAGIALSLTGAKRPTSALAAAGVAGVLGLLALKGAFGGFGEMAFVASLFVLVAALPTLLLLGAFEFVLRKRASDSPAHLALRAGTRERFGAALALLVSGFLARDSFSARPDAFAALGILLLVGTAVVSIVRGTGRAARD